MLPILLSLLLAVPKSPEILSPFLAQQAEAATDYSTTTLRNYAEAVAASKHLNVDHFLKTIDCESGFMWNATSTTADFGVAQWNPGMHDDPAKHFYITKTEALDPYYSINKMAEAWKDGHARWWVCYQKLFE